MSLREVTFEEDYRTGEHVVLDEFFRPCLMKSRDYWRAVGYFSSSALEAFGQPLDAFVQTGGKIRLVTSVELSSQDVKAIQDGARRREICERKIEAILDEQFSGPSGSGVEKLAALMEIGRLEIKIAVPTKGRGIYHEKVGVFFDGNDYVAFSGSTNESWTAFEENYECLDVYPSWSEEKRALRKRRHFEAVWAAAARGLEVYEFSDAHTKKLIRYVRENRKKAPKKDKVSEKWRHQVEAKEAFLKAERGILNMATGTGKTRTAISIVKALLDQQSISRIVVATDGNDLLDQWHREILRARDLLGAQIHLYRDYKNYKERDEFLLDRQKSLIIVSRDGLSAVLGGFSADEARRTIVVHDEVHGLGTTGLRKKLEGLSDPIRFRLGLSATPERPYDEDGTKFIKESVGEVIFNFELTDAIKRGILSPFNYFPIEYQLTDDDRQALKNVYKKRAARTAAGNPMSDRELWIELARVYKTSQGKLPEFSRFIAERPELLRRAIIFVETREYATQVLDIVHQYRDDFHTYFSGEDATTLERFASGDLECLITCHRLSQGIDIQSLNSVILFSSERGQLETIQRIGRCLRADPTNPRKIANVVDFIRTSDPDKENPDLERSAWLTELSQIRAQEI